MRSAYARNTKNLFSKKLPISLCLFKSIFIPFGEKLPVSLCFEGTFDYVDFPFKSSLSCFCASRKDASLGRTIYSSLTASCRDASLTGCNGGDITFATERSIPDGVPKSDNPYRDFFCDPLNFFCDLLNYTLYELSLINNSINNFLSI